MPDLTDLNYHHLLYFWTVAREGSVAAATRKLNLAQPTISMQLAKLQRSLGCQLFERVGRGLVLTDMGQTVFRYADEIFDLGRELQAVVGGQSSGRPLRLVVGVPDALPKLVTYRLLKPVFKLTEPIQLECFEAKLEQLLADLAANRFDVLLTDAPLGVGARVRAFNHPLGDCGIVFCGTAALARRYRRTFPHSLAEAPLLLPSEHTDLRRSLDHWFDEQGIRPNIVGQFDDSALMKEFGLGGLGLFPVPQVVLAEVKRQYQVAVVGALDAVRSRFFAITSVRRLKHPAVIAISETARRELFD